MSSRRAQRRPRRRIAPSRLSPHLTEASSPWRLVIAVIGGVASMVRQPNSSDQTACSSATVRAESRMRSPSATSSSVTLHGGTAWMRLKFANGNSPPDLHAASTAAMAGLEPPYGAKGSRVF